MSCLCNNVWHRHFLGMHALVLTYLRLKILELLLFGLPILFYFVLGLGSGILDSLCAIFGVLVSILEFEACFGLLAGFVHSRAVSKLTCKSNGQIVRMYVPF